MPISQAPLLVSENGFPESYPTFQIDFTGSGVAVTPGPTKSIVNIPGGGGAGGALALLSTFTFTGAESDHSFSAISGAYQDLIISFAGRSTRVDLNDGFYIQVNGDSGNNYSSDRWNAQFGNSINGFIDRIDTGNIPASLNPAGASGSFEITLAQYADPTFFRSIKALAGTLYAADFSQISAQLAYGLWKDTANAITSIRIFNFSGLPFVAGSKVTLYGRG